MTHKLEHLSRLLQSEVEEAADEVLEHMLSSAPDYPPPIPGSRYIRTYKLADAVTSKKNEHDMSLSEMEPMGDGAIVTIGVSGYGPYVIGKKHQVRPHTGRWWTMQEVVDDNTRQILNIVKAHIRKAKRIAF